MQTEPAMDESEIFEKSGQPNNIHDYQCFDDQSKLDWIYGTEYKDNPQWSQRRKDLWKFFYPPYNYGNNIAGEQKKIIKALSGRIKVHQDELESYRVLKYFSVFIFVIICLMLLISSDLWVMFAIPLLAYGFFQIKEWQVQNTIKPIKKELGEYQSEVDDLISQQQSILQTRTSSEDVEKILWDDLVKLEHEAHYEYFFTRLDQVRSKVPRFYEEVNARLKSSQKIIDPPCFPAIPTWGLLQPVKASNNDSRATGIRAAWEDLGEKIATFRSLKDGRPFYRLWYIQYIFITKKNFSVVSFCYDIISQEKYNLAGDTHQLNHITNSSSGFEDIVHMIDSRFVELLELPSLFKKSIFVSQVKNLKYTMSSGASYSCFIPSEKVIAGLSVWQNHKNTKQRVYDEDLPEGHELHELSRVQLTKNTVLEIIADKVADTLRKNIDESSPLTAEEHRRNRKITS